MDEAPTTHSHIQDPGIKATWKGSCTCHGACRSVGDCAGPLVCDGSVKAQVLAHGLSRLLAAVLAAVHAQVDVAALKVEVPAQAHPGCQHWKEQGQEQGPCPARVVGVARRAFPLRSLNSSTASWTACATARTAGATEIVRNGGPRLEDAEERTRCRTRSWNSTETCRSAVALR